MSEASLYNPPVARTKSYSLALEIKREYLKALLACGYGANTHVYDLGRLDFTKRMSAEATEDLLRIKRFYEGLESFERDIFLRDFLEMGRYYPYWFYEYGDSKTWFRTFEEISDKWRRGER